jgi:high-affinity iron transporter
MLQSFIIVLREGFESFLLVAVILSYLRKSGQRQLAPAVYWAILISLAISGALGYLLFQMQTGNDAVFEQYLGQRVGASVGLFFGNEALREGILGVVAIVMVASLVIYMWRVGPKLKEKMEARLGRSVQRSGWAAFLGVFLFTLMTVSREGMETALMLLQVRNSRLVWGVLLGLSAAGGLAWAWAQFGHLINVRRFFQLTGVFLLLFMIQVGIYSFHEFSEAGVLPNSEALHAATESLSPEGLYGKWFSIVMVGFCGAWLVGAWIIDRIRQPASPSLTPVQNSQ